MAKWVPTGGSARRFRNVGAPTTVGGNRINTGDTISRRAYDDIRARRAGFRNRYELEETRQGLAGSRWLYDIYRHTGKPPTFQDYRDIRAVKARRAELEAQHGPYWNQRQREIEAGDPFLSDPDGPLARILARSGRRTGYGGRPVGGS